MRFRITLAAVKNQTSFFSQDTVQFGSVFVLKLVAAEDLLRRQVESINKVETDSEEPKMALLQLM